MSTNALMLEMQKKKTSHVLHLVLSLITGGLWILIWICCAIANGSHNRQIDKRISRIYEADAREGKCRTQNGK